MADPSDNAGAWNQDLPTIRATWLTGKGSDTDLPEAVRFLRAVRMLVFWREQVPDCELDRPAAMVLVSGAFYENTKGLTRHPFLNTGKDRLTGKLHYLGVAASGRSRDYVGGDGDLIDGLAQDRADGLPTVIYTPQKGGHSKLSWFPTGTRDLDNVQVFQVAIEEPTLDLISLAIDGVYQGELKTPDGVPREASVWEKAGEGWASDKAEARVQRTVKIGLHARFPHCRIKAEQPDKDGRTDLEVVGDFGVAPNASTNFAVLEMKVLREKGSGGSPYAPSTIESHIKDGVAQAYAYADDRCFRDRMLCCFDMRAINAGPEVVFSQVKDDADALGVRLGYWFLYRSSEHYRECKVAAALTNG